MNKNLLVGLVLALFSFNASAAFVVGDVSYATDDAAATSGSWADLSNGWQVTSQIWHDSPYNEGMSVEDTYSFQMKKGYVYDVSFAVQNMGHDTSDLVTYSLSINDGHTATGIVNNRVTALGVPASLAVSGTNLLANIDLTMAFDMDAAQWRSTTFSINESAVPVPAGIFLFAPALALLARRKIKA